MFKVSQLESLIDVMGFILQIRQLRHLTDGSINVVTKGRQRFRVCKAWTEADGAVCGSFPAVLFSSTILVVHLTMLLFSAIYSGWSVIFRLT